MPETSVQKESNFFLWKLLKVLEMFFCVVPIAVMTIVIFTSVIFRYVLLNPLGWAEEATKACLVWGVMGGSSYAFYHKLNVGVTFVIDRFHGKTRHIIEIILLLGTMIFMGLIMILGWSAMLNVIGKYTNAAHIPLWIPYLAIPVGGAMSILRLIELLLIEFRSLNEPEEGKEA
jgi:TRAP-type C4-dicarboxylate transport system permease small subunit